MRYPDRAVQSSPANPELVGGPLNFFRGQGRGSLTEQCADDVFASASLFPFPLARHLVVHGRPQSFRNLGTGDSHVSRRIAFPFSGFYTHSQISCSCNPLKKLKSSLTNSRNVRLGVDAGRIAIREACALMGLRRRQVFRLLAVFRVRGASSLASKRRGGASNNRLPTVVRLLALAIAKERYTRLDNTASTEAIANDLRRVRKLRLAACPRRIATTEDDRQSPLSGAFLLEFTERSDRTVSPSRSLV
jgi:hypothetical protein